MYSTPFGPRNDPPPTPWGSQCRPTPGMRCYIIFWRNISEKLIQLHRLAQGLGVDAPVPLRGLSFFLGGGNQNYFNIKPRKSILHYPFMTPGKHHVPRWKFSLQKCIKSQIYNIPFWPVVANLIETFEKLAAKRLKIRFLENRFWPPGGSYRVHLWIVLVKSIITGMASGG